MLTIKTSYICPNVDVYQKFEDFLNSRKDIRYSRFLRREGIRSKEDIFELMYKAPKSLILAEPGYGKTRLLQEFQEYPRKLDKQAVFVDLKLFAKEKTLETFIIEQAKLQGISLSSLNSNIVLCFDALDEIKQDAFYELVRQVKLFFETHKEIKVIFSCRLLFYKKYPVFEGNNFTYMSIDDFDFEQVKAYLKEILTEDNKRIFSDTEIDTIIQDFKEPNWESIILIPRYLEEFVEFRKSHPNEKPTRSSLYDFFINERLEIEDSKRGAQDKVIIRRVLEKIALVMEIYQKNEISKDELLTIMEDIQSQMTGNFLDMGKLQILFEHSLWKDYGNTISYEDHTIQEYLASCELLRLGWQKHLYEFVVDPLVNEIHPSWFGALGFCVDQDLNLFERDRIIERVFPGMIKGVQRGNWQGARYSPYGYRYNKEKKLLEVVKEEADIVKMIYLMYLSGQSTMQIAGYLYQKCYKTRSGGRFHTKLICDILKSQMYLGKLVWNKRHYDKAKRTLKGCSYVRNNPSDVIVAQGRHEPIIAQDDFDAVQRKLEEARKGVVKKANSHEYPLTGILFAIDAATDFRGALTLPRVKIKRQKAKEGITDAAQGRHTISNAAILM